MKKKIRYLIIIFIFCTVAVCSGCKNRQNTDSNPAEIQNIDSEKTEASLLLLTEMLKDENIIFYLFKRDNERKKFVIKDNKELLKLINLFMRGSTNKIKKSPDDCSLYAFRSYLMAITRSEKFLFGSIDMVEKFHPKNWETNMLIAYAFFQKWDDKKTLYYLDEAEKKYCKTKNQCDSSNKVVATIEEIRQKVKTDAKKRKNRLSKLKLSNHENCYFMELNKEDNAKDEAVFWSGKCNNGWAEGKGVLEYKDSGNKYNVFFEKGYFERDIEINTKKGMRIVGKMKDGFKSGKWEHFNSKKQPYLTILNHDENGRIDGKVIERINVLDSGQKMRIETVFEEGIPQRTGHVFIDNIEYSFSIYRYTQQMGYDFKIFMGEEYSLEKALQKLQSQSAKERETLEKVLEENSEINSDCKILDGFDSVVYDLLSIAGYFKKENES